MKVLNSDERIFSVISNEIPVLCGKSFSFLAGPFEHILGLKDCEIIYQKVKNKKEPKLFMHHALIELDVHPIFDLADKRKIPQKNACVVVSNHPFGGIEGIILAELLLSIRPDVKIMANVILDRIPQLRNIIISVDLFEKINSARKNIAPIREAMRWVKEGGLLLIFPAGEVSHYKIWRHEITDPPWNNTVARIVHHGKASVVPIFFDGHNSTFFQIAGLFNPRLRTAMLARELLKIRGKEIKFKIGNTINYDWLQRYSEDTRLTNYLRWRTYVMGYKKRRIIKLPSAIDLSAPKRYKSIAGPQSSKMCRQEIENLPSSQKLVQSGPFKIWQAHAMQIPHVLREIGRLREISFRLAGEGSGKSIDIDRFDAHYIHLFIWNEESMEIVGAYRVGRTDKILSKMGKKGLYTSTLFHSGIEFFNKLNPALEMGRSFIRPEYQKSYSSLLLLWKGVGTFITRHPEYRMLLGPVSISSDYSDLSRRLLATTLLRHSQAKDLSMMVRPKTPVRLKPLRVRGCDTIEYDVQLHDFKEVCSVVSDIELKQRDVPVLLRKYLNLGGQLLSFNIDKTFGKAMDGLIVVDLLQTERRTLERFMGKEGLNSFLSYHSIGRSGIRDDHLSGPFGSNHQGSHEPISLSARVCF